MDRITVNRICTLYSDRVSRSHSRHIHDSLSSFNVHVILALHRARQLSANLRSDLIVCVCPHHLLELLTVVVLQLTCRTQSQQFVSLREDEKRSVPQHGEGASVADEGMEVVHHLIQRLVGQGVLLVEQHRDEIARRAVPWPHAAQECEGSGRVDDGHRHLGQNAPNYHRLAKCAVVLCERQQDALEPRCWLEHSLFERLVVVEVESPVGLYVLPDGRQQHQVVEALGHGRRHVGGEDLGGGEHGAGRPVDGVRQVDELLPRLETRYHLERLRKLPRLVLAHPLADRRVDLHGLGRDARGGLHQRSRIHHRPFRRCRPVFVGSRIVDSMAESLDLLLPDLLQDELC
mmetsp:Transcript_45363/g.112675  ORF Transcript_45363/g.112675 Transcript_45363/m.112675 type:complete len:346 (-) Transcript_45363:612-1649(-)